MLDIGGSHGLYSAAICRRNPPMRSEIVELPEMIQASRRVAEEWRVDEYVDYCEGDIESVKLTEQYDVVFLGNILHHSSEERTKTIIDKAANYLSTKGTLAIWDLRTPTENIDEISAAFSLFFYITSGAGCHSEQIMRHLLETAGFTTVSTHYPPGPSTHVLYTARDRNTREI